MEVDQKIIDDLSLQMSEIKELDNVNPDQLIQLINLWLKEKKSP